MKQEKTLDEKIEIAQKEVSKFHKPYAEAMEELNALMNQKNEHREKQLWDAFMHSQRDYDQVMTFLKTPVGEWDDEDWYP